MINAELRRLVQVVAEHVRPAQAGAGSVAAGEAAAAWVIGAVFVRFAEDNGLLARSTPPRPAGDTPSWLCSRFDTFAAADPGSGLFDRRANPLYQTMISEAGARHLIRLWERDGQGQPVHDFAVQAMDTRFLGDLYEDLTDHARERNALVQTPQFVVDFLLDRTVPLAIREFGYDRLRLVDPVCGSGAFLSSAFSRLLEVWGEAEPGMPIEERVARALAAVHGRDLHPLAAAISRFRLLIAAVRASGATTLDAVSGGHWRFHIATADSLLDDDLSAEGYEVVVGNPPYTTVRDKDRDRLYRSRYDACQGKYALTVPFTQRFFELARPGGYVGLLASNSFLKREFGRTLATDVLAGRVALTHIIDTSGAFIPGHGTPTVILLGRNYPADQAEPVFTVVGVRGEPEVPADPAHGLVWQSILRHSEHGGRADEWTVSRNLDREQLRSFPWQLTTDEAAGVLDTISAAPTRLRDVVRRVGYFASSGADDVFTAPCATFARHGILRRGLVAEVITGSEVRDWTASPERCAFFPYDQHRQVEPLDSLPGHHDRLWPYRTVLGRRPTSAGSHHRPGRFWYEWHQLAGTPGAQPHTIVYSWVATHNHFAPLRDGAVPLPSAPVIELAPDAPLHRADLVALLNSSTAGFWLRQVSYRKGRPDVEQTGSGERWDDYLDLTATRLLDLPLPERQRTTYAAELDRLAGELAAASPAAVVAAHPPSRDLLADARTRWEGARARMISLQEELDWEVYLRYGLLGDPALVAPLEAVPPLQFGERAFEIILARRLAGGEVQTDWFTRHGGVPVTEPSPHWPVAYAEVVDCRIDAIRRDQRLAALERPEFKRRWASPGWDSLQAAALREWLLDRCETPLLWYEDRGGTQCARPLTADQLADLLRTDASVVTAAELYAPGQQLVDVLRELIADEHVPYLAALRYREAGLAKRAAWEEVWQLQRHEDDLRAQGDDPSAIQLRDRIPDPPRYTSVDFLRPGYWRRRGKYDVPNERFISYAHPVGGPTTDLLIGWAGWTPAERAQVLADLIVPVQPDRQTVLPLLAGLREVLPWVAQSSPDAGEFFRALLDTWVRRLDLTESQLAGWRPPPLKRGRPRKIA